MIDKFAKNMKYFYDNIPHFYQLIKNIKTRRFKIIRQNGFNIYDTKSNTYFYPIENGKHLMESISQLYANNPMKNELWKKFFLTKELPYYDEKILPSTSTICNKIIFKTKQSKSFSDDYYYDKTFLYTTTIFGIGSGLHIEYLTQKYNFQSLFIYEPEAEFFAISCYFVDWERIYKKLGDRFYLFVNGNIDTKILKRFYDTRIVTSNFLRLEFSTYSSDKIENAKKEFYLANISNKRGWGSFEDEVIGFKNHLLNIGAKNKIDDNYSYLTTKIPILKKIEKINVPICVIANGASLNNEIEWIKENQNNMIIVSVGTAIRPLLKNNIHSDFHIEIERSFNLVDILRDSLKKYRGYFVGASVIDTEHFKIAKKPLMFVRDASSSIGISSYFLKYCSPLVGNCGFSFAGHLSDEIYMIGFDVGFKKGKRVHSKGSLYDNEDDVAKNGYPVKGNFSNDIYSNDLLNLSRQNLEFTISRLNLKKVYNLSDGAYIYGTIPKFSKEIKLKKIDKQFYIKKIVSNFGVDKIKVFNYEGFMKLYKNKIIELLDKDIKNREDLTNILDLVTDYTITFYNYEPTIGTLMRGSIWHILNILYLSLHKVSIQEYSNLLKIIKKGLKEEFIFDF